MFLWTIPVTQIHTAHGGQSGRREKKTLAENIYYSKRLWSLCHSWSGVVIFCLPAHNAKILHTWVHGYRTFFAKKKSTKEQFVWAIVRMDAYCFFVQISVIFVMNECGVMQ